MCKKLSELIWLVAAQTPTSNHMRLGMAGPVVRTPAIRQGSLLSIPTIGVRGVFLQRGGISQASMLLPCFNSAGGQMLGYEIVA